MRGTLIPFVVVVGLVSPGLPANESLVEEYSRREAEIAAEIIDGSMAPWAGEYRSGDGLGANVTLVIAPDHGFTAIWTGCRGVYGRSFGSVTQQGDHLFLNHETPNQPGMSGNFSNVLVLVRRDENVYLVGEEQMGEFVHAVDTASEECRDLCGRFLLRVGWELMVERIPTLAAEYAIESSDRPLYVRVTKVIEPDLDAVDGQFRWRKSTVELDVGSDGGVWEGMEFFSSTAGWIADTITVVEVKDASAVATVSAYDQLPIPVQAGTCVSTYYDDAIEKRVYGRPQEGCDDDVITER